MQAPLIFTGLSVAFSFRTGVFNIGAEGQFVSGEALPQPVYMDIVLNTSGSDFTVTAMSDCSSCSRWLYLVCIIVGLLKVKRGIHEVSFLYHV